MGKRRTTPTAAERSLEEQVRVTRAIVGTAMQKGDTGNAVKAQTLLSRLVSDLERHRAARLASAETDPIARIGALRRLAEADGSWVAAARYAADERQATIDDMAAEQERMRRAEVETPELRAARVLDHSRSAPLDELEVYVREWASRHRHELYVTDQGEIAIRRV